MPALDSAVDLNARFVVDGEAAAREADLTIVFVGIGQEQERESLDRDDIGYA